MSGDAKTMKAPPMPDLEAIESLAASELPSAHVAWWVTAQVATHVLSVASTRDTYTGEPLPVSLLATLRKIDRAVRRGVRPLPVDSIQQTAEMVLEPLGEVLSQPRMRIMRQHTMQPIHRLRELDSTAMDWLGRQPGRTIREKLGGRTTALAMVRSFSPNTVENRLVGKLIRVLGPLVAERLEAAKAGAYDQGERDQRNRDILLACHKLCEIGRRSPVLADIDCSGSIQPNNVLLGDRQYSRLWRGWLGIRDRQDEFERLWTACEERFCLATFWSLVARLSGLPNVWLCDTLARINTGPEGGAFGLVALGHAHGQPVWRIPNMVSLTTEAPPPSATHLRGWIRALKDSPRGPFGFITTDDGVDYYFDSRLLQRGSHWEDFRIGENVVFVPQAGVSQRGDRATRVEHAIDAVRIDLRLEGQSITMETRGLVGSGVLIPTVSPLSTTRYGIHLDSAAPQARRGTVARFGNGADTRKRASFREPADLAGIRRFIEEATTSALGSPQATTATHSSSGGTDVQQPIASVGLDLGSILPNVDVDNRLVEVKSSMYAVKYWMPSGEGFEWLVGGPDGWSDVLTVIAQSVGIQDVLGSRAETDEQDMAIAMNRVFRSLREELDADVGATTSASLAFTVPETADEFSQHILRSCVGSVFATAIPVWRSAAIALGWQQSDSFAKSSMRSGDVLLVVDPLGDSLAITLLTARHDPDLERLLPATRGIYWERRPPIVGAALPERLEEFADELALKRLLQRYLESSLRDAVTRGVLKKESFAMIVDRLLRMGVAEAAVCQQRTVFLPMGLVEPSGVLHLAPDAARWSDLAREWRRALARYLDSVARTEGFRELLRDAIARGQKAHLMLAGLPFCLPDVGGPLAEDLSHAFPSLEIHECSESPHIAAAGARHFLERRALRLVSWRDWLPDLYLEVVKDGHYHELQLMQAKVGGDAVLGEPLTFDVPETLELPADTEFFSFPLLTGRNRQRLPFDAQLHSPAFPLKAPLGVTLSLSYRYGLENAYELILTPVGQSGLGLGTMTATWRRRGSTAGSGPDPVPPALYSWKWGHHKLKNYEEWLLDKAPSFVALCEELFVAWPESRARLSSVANGLRRQYQLPAATDRVTNDFQLVSTWIRRAVAPPLRALWDRGRALKGAPPEINEVMNAGIVNWLLNLSGLQVDQMSHALLADPQASAGLAELRHTTLLALSYLHEDAPSVVADWLCARLREGGTANPDWAHCLRSAAFIIGGGQSNRESVLRALHDAVLNAYSVQAGRSASRVAVVEALALAMWRDGRAVFSLAGKVEIDALLEIIFVGMRNLSDDGHTQDPDPLAMLSREFTALCETMLALLRLRRIPGIAHRLRSISPRLDQLARSVRRADRRFASARVPVRSVLSFQMEKPSELWRMSDLAYALSCYLTADSGSNLIHIAQDDVAQNEQE